MGQAERAMNTSNASAAGKTRQPGLSSAEALFRVIVEVIQEKKERDGRKKHLFRLIMLRKKMYVCYNAA
jgi:hypothetical protein